MTIAIRYAPLKDQANNFRLVKLLPAADSPGLPVLEIEEYPRDACPEYTALSYVWGEASGPRGHVIVNDARVEVGKTVETVLRHLTADQPLWLWIDQLCINQTDDTEKSDQVQQMHRIYAVAKQTVAWLGADDEGMEVLFYAVETTSEAIRRGSYESLQRVYLSDETGAEETRREISQAFASFCAKPYWTRLWVIQEFAVARHVIIRCGDHTVHWQDFDQVLNVHLNRPLDTDEEVDEIESSPPSEDPETLSEDPETLSEEDLDALENAINQVFYAPEMSYVNSVFTRRSWWLEYHKRGQTPETFQRLIDVITTSLLLEQDYNTMQATDDRDRIFSLLNLANDKHKFSNFPDYNKTTTDVYVEAARLFLEHGELELLQCNQFPKNLDSLPSWAPDWSMAIRWPARWLQTAREGLDDDNQPRVSFPGPGLLEIEGISVDTIVELGPSWDPDWREPMDHKAAVPYLRSIEAFCQRSPRVPATEVRHVAGRVAVAGAVGHDLDVHGEGEAESFVSGFEHVLYFADDEAEETENTGEVWEDETEEQTTASEPDSSDDDTIAGVYCGILAKMHSRTPFMSFEGHVGVCSWNAEVGDRLCFFSGSSIPFVLRSTEDNKFVLVGDAYIDDAMEGQLFHDTPKQVFLIR